MPSGIKTIDWNAAAGVVRAIAPFICTVLVGYHLIPDTVAAQLPGELVTLVLSVGGLVTVVSAIWSLFSNKAASVASQAASIDGVQVVASKDAPVGIKQLAHDPAQPDVVMQGAQ